MQVFSFVEDTVSPFPGRFHGSQYDKVPLPAAFDRLASSIMDLGGYLKRSHFDSEERRARSFPTSVALSSFAGVKLTPAEKDRGRQCHLRFRSGAGSAAQRSADAGCGPHAGAHASHEFPAHPENTGRLRRNLVASMAWVPQAQGGRGLFLSLGGGVQSPGACPKWCFNAELQCAGAVSVIIGGDRKLQFHGPDEQADFRGVVSFEARPDPTSDHGPGIQSRDRDQHGARRPSWCVSKASLTQKAAQIRLSDARRCRDAESRLVRQLHREDPAEGRPARELRHWRRSRESSVAAFFEGMIRSAGTGGNPRPTTPPPPGVQPPPLPPLPPETGSGIRLDDPDRQVTRSADDSQPAAAPRDRRRRRQDDVPAASRELDQHEAGPGDGARRSRRSEVRRADSGPGRRREGQPRLRGCRRRRGTAQRRLARHRCERRT